VRRILRISAIVLLGLVVVVGLGCLGLRAYLNTGSAHRLISDSLTDRFGGDIVVKEVSSGMGSTSVEIELPGSANEPTPIVKGTVHLDASPVALAAGSTPGTVTIEKAQITLHFDKDGNITDKLPQPKSGGGGNKLPTIQVNGASVHFVQEGKPDFRASGLDVSISDGGAKIAISGKAQDANWGGWTLNGEWNSDGSAGSLDFKSNGSIPFTPEKLRSIPFVPLEVWEVVQLDGTSPVHVRVGRDAESKWWWQVTAQPTASKLHVSAIDLGFTEVTGKVFVEGTKVVLSDVVGKTADGTVKMNAKLDFPPKKADLDFDVSAQGLDIAKLPKAWNLPPQFTAGKAIGGAKVRVVIEGDKTTTTGGGKVELENAELFGNIPAEKAEFEMYSDGKRLRFGSPPPKLPDQKIRQKLPNPDPAQAVGLFLFLLQQSGTIVQPKAADPTYVQANLKLKDVDLAEFLSKAMIVMPVKVAGKLTLEIAAEIPINDAGKLKAYRVKGSASIPELQIEGLVLKNLTANVELRNGIMRLTKLAADVPDSTATGKGGSFLGTALVGVDPVGDLTADLKLTDLPLGPLVAAVPGLADVATGSVSGSFNLSSPGEKLSDLNNLKGSGKLTSESLSIYKNKIDNLTVELSVEKGIAQIIKASAELFRGSLEAKGKFSLTGAEAGAINLAFKDIDAVAATKGIPDLPVKIEGRVSGKLNGTLLPRKDGEPQTANGSLNLEAPQLKIQGIPAQRLKGAIGYKPDGIRYELKGESLGGTFDLDGTYPLGKPKAPANPPPVGPPQTSHLKVTNLRLDKLAEGLGIPALASLRGALSAVVFFDFDADGPSGKGWIDLVGFGWGTEKLSNLSAFVRITPQKIELSEIGGTIANGTVRGRLVYGLGDARQRNYALHLQSVNVETLLAPFGIKNIEGEAEVSIRGSIGREIRGTGTVLCSRAIVDGIRIENLRSSLEWAVVPGGSGQFSVRELNARIAGGRVRGDGLVRWNGAIHAEGKIDFTDVYIRGLLAQLGQSTSTISGRTSGKFQFGGSRIQSANDIQGTLNATLGDAQVSALPVFRALTPYVAPLRATQPFKEGVLQARLGGGKFHFERVALAGPSVTMLIDGDIFLNGRLDLNVVANTGSLAPTPGTFGFLGVRLPAIGPIPVALVLEILNYLSNRVVRLTVGGTFDRPSVQVNTLALLSDEAIRFFLNRYFSVNNQTLTRPR